MPAKEDHPGGLVENRAAGGNAYELHATPAGEAEIAYWVANG